MDDADSSNEPWGVGNVPDTAAHESPVKTRFPRTTITDVLSGKKIKSRANVIILFLSILVFTLASKGYSILYLFLLADLFCCAFVLTIFYSFYNKNINEKTAYISIIVGLIAGFLMFPSPDFSKSLLVGVLVPTEEFSPFISQSLLFLSFVVATFLPFIILKFKK